MPQQGLSCRSRASAAGPQRLQRLQRLLQQQRLMSGEGAGEERRPLRSGQLASVRRLHPRPVVRASG